MKRICVFCGSSSGNRSEYRPAAEEMGAELVRNNIGLVYGGGNVGLMGILADAVLRAGGEAQREPDGAGGRAQRAHGTPGRSLHARAQGAHGRPVGCVRR